MAESLVHAADAVTLVHSAPRAQLEQILQSGLKARSTFGDLGLEMRRGVVFCWLRPEHDKMWGASPDHAHLRITVDAWRCRVAEMDFASIALMYLQGQGGKPRHPEAAALLARLYELTSVPLSQYREGMFWTPEVLVQGDIPAAQIALLGDPESDADVLPGDVPEA
ncbi:MAG: hypothetical protein AB1505_18345 [Candidatus Latescibacterota bacterium]